jgi:hypothetical protein
MALELWPPPSPLAAFLAALLVFHSSEFALAVLFMHDELSLECEPQQILP